MISHKLLSRQLRKLENDRTIHRIKSKSGTYLLSPIEINNRFKQFYESLYISNKTDDSSTMEAFLNGCNLTTLDQEDREFLGADLTDELKGTIRYTPGPDGIACEVYKTFNNWDLICLKFSPRLWRWDNYHSHLTKR